MQHGLSIDVEDYYQVFYRDTLGRDIALTPEVAECTTWLLETLARHDTQATFFFLGNVAEAFPRLVQEVYAAGHEIGVHGHDHKYIRDLTPENFRSELLRAKNTLEDLTGAAVNGHRAPAFSISTDTPWAFDVLLELGFSYDSSVFPIRGRRYGLPHLPATIFKLPNGLYEIPLSTIDIGWRRIPAAGGGYFRHFPYAWTHWCMKHLERRIQPAIVYLHPYEFSLQKPHIPEITLRMWRARMKNLLQGHRRGWPQRKKLGRLLADFSFATLDTLLNTAGPVEKFCR